MIERRKQVHPLIEQYIGRKLSIAKAKATFLEGANAFLKNGEYEAQLLFKSYASIEDPSIEIAKLSELQREYRKFFRDLLTKKGVVSPSELSDQDKIDLFNAVSKHWQKGVGARKDAKDIEL